MKKLLIFLLVVPVFILSSCFYEDSNKERDDDTYTVSFIANGGKPAPAQQKIKQSGKVIQPDVMTKEDCIFDGWYKDNSYTIEWNFDVDILQGNITLYAKWKTVVPGKDLDEKLGWITLNAQNYGYYIIEIDKDITIGSKRLSFNEKKITIELIGIETKRTINGGVFTICSSVNLIISNNIELKGKTNGSGSLIKVESGGSLVLNQGAKISGQTNSYNGDNYFGTVIVDRGDFIMNGGEISGNTNEHGTVNVSGGTFTMNNGVICDNKGSGVYVHCSINFPFTISGSFNMNGGEIKGNESRSCGAGVYLYNSLFNKTGGIIYGYTEGDSNSNVVKESNGSVGQKDGHAVYVTSSIVRFKDTTSGENDNLYFDGRKNPPPLSGEWEQ